jgi:uncharacterized protein (DUF362 family)/Pyruvate/2-oxoacid:ferredoxin oxidoreductase delta subunit
MVFVITMDDKVFIVRCPDYSEVGTKMAELLAMMGGMDSFAQAGERIVLKVNLLQPAKVEKAVTTHPTVVSAVARLVKDAGAIPIIADSPGSGYPYTERSLDKFYRICGMYGVAEEEGIALNLDTGYEIVSYPEGELIKRFEVITPVLESDAVFNLCKLKTHAFMHLTGAVKNIFGVVPGLTKPGYHVKLREKSYFAAMLLDLAEYVSPRLSIMDAVMGLEGEGPGSRGKPRHVGLLIAAKSPLALDVVASDLIGLKREQNPVSIEAKKRGLYPNRLEDVEIIGADISELRIPDYKLPATVAERTGLGRLQPFAPLIKSGMTLKPRVIKDNCTACGACRDSCPSEAITLTDEECAQIEDDKCIRCYCCHEMCPESAIELHQSLMYRLINR